MADYVRHIRVQWNDCDPARIVFHAHFVRWMDEGFHEMARARGLDFARLQAADPDFRNSPLVAVSCSYSVPALYGDLLEHRIAPPSFGPGRSFRVTHSFHRNGALAAAGEQTRIWGRVEPGSERLRAVPVPPEVAARLRGEMESR